MIYLDSSALVKLALTEPETEALTEYLAARAGQALVSSSMHRAEVLRAIWRAEPGALPRAQRMIRRVSLISLTHDMLDNAATQQPGSLSTSAAIHVASALTVKRDLTAFVCYDKSLGAAAAQAGLPVASPA
jgi:predicted nucleic acid-binding protein